VEVSCGYTDITGRITVCLLSYMIMIFYYIQQTVQLCTSAVWYARAENGPYRHGTHCLRLYTRGHHHRGRCITYGQYHLHSCDRYTLLTNNLCTTNSEQVSAQIYGDMTLCQLANIGEWRLVTYCAKYFSYSPSRCFVISLDSRFAFPPWLRVIVQFLLRLYDMNKQGRF